MPRTSNPSGLSAKQERFIAEYLIDGNGTRSAVAAGYSPRTAKYAAYELLKKPAIRAAVDAAQKRVAKKLELTAEKVLADIDRIAQKAERAKEFNAALKGRELLGKHIRLFTDKVELTGANEGPVEFTEIRRTIVRPAPTKP